MDRMSGAEFEKVVQEWFAEQGISLQRPFSVEIGMDEAKGSHKFDLGSDDLAMLVECKAHTWTAAGNHPSAKMSVWNEAMLYFLAAPKHYRKILVALRSMRSGLSLADRYVAYHGHLIPKDVEVWEFDPDHHEMRQIVPVRSSGEGSP